MTAPSATARAPSLADYALLLALAVIWGASFTLIKVGVETVPAASLTAGRLVVAAVVMIAVALHYRQRLRLAKAPWGLIALAALTGNALPFLLIAWGEEGIDSGLAAILMGVMPLAAMALAHVLTPDDRLTRGKIVGCLLGLAGLVVLIGPDKLSRLGDDVVRQLAIALAAVSYGLNANLTRSLTGGPPHATVAVVMVASLVMALPVALVANAPLMLEPSLASVAAVIALGVFQTGLGTVMMFELIRRRGASFFAQINFLVPVSGVLWGALFLGERPGPAALVALALILLGVGIARVWR